MTSSDSSLPAAAGVDLVCHSGTFHQEQQSMIRCVAAAFVCVPLMAGTVCAQAGVRAFDGAHVRISPHFVYVFGATRVEDRVIDAGGVVQPYRADFDLGAGYGAGLHLEVPITGPFALFAAGSWLRRESSREFSELEGGTRVEAGSNFASVRGGASVRLYQEPRLQLRHLSASIYAGPLFLRELPRTDPFRTAAQAVSLVGTHAGVEAEWPFGNRVALSAGLENNVVWWQDDELARRNDSVYASIGIETTTTVTTRPTPLWSLRAGFSIRP
jgi:hypothetical protein